MVLIVALLLLVVTVHAVSVILDKAGYSRWWAVLYLVPVVNLVMLMKFAYADWPMLREARQVLRRLDDAG